MEEPWTPRPHDPPASGMGPAARGPDFVPTPPPPATVPPPSAPSRHDRRTPSSTLPRVVTAAAIALVGLVVAVATLVARYNDTHVAVPTATSAPARPTSQPTDRIDFTTARGSGQLVLVSHTWVKDGIEPPRSGSYLRLEVELLCTDGRVDFGPYNFRTFDRSGQLYYQAAAGAGDPLLEVGTLRAGERVRGMIAFDMARGDATLLMSDDGEQTVTALHVPD